MIVEQVLPLDGERPPSSCPRCQQEWPADADRVACTCGREYQVTPTGIFRALPRPIAALA